MTSRLEAAWAAVITQWWSSHLRNMGKVRSIVRTLNFRKANIQLFKELVRRTPWETVLRDKAAEQSRQIFKDAFQELSVSRCKKSGKEGKRPA